MKERGKKTELFWDCQKVGRERIHVARKHEQILQGLAYSTLKARFGQASNK